jgi:hypothetical protein
MREQHPAVLDAYGIRRQPEAHPRTVVEQGRQSRRSRSQIAKIAAQPVAHVVDRRLHSAAGYVDALAGAVS